MSIEFMSDLRSIMVQYPNPATFPHLRMDWQGDSVDGVQGDLFVFSDDLKDLCDEDLDNLDTIKQSPPKVDPSLSQSRISFHYPRAFNATESPESKPQSDLSDPSLRSVSHSRRRHRRPRHPHNHHLMVCSPPTRSRVIERLPERVLELRSKREALEMIQNYMLQPKRPKPVRRRLLKKAPPVPSLKVFECVPSPPLSTKSSTEDEESPSMLSDFKTVSPKKRWQKVNDLEHKSDYESCPESPVSVEDPVSEDEQSRPTTMSYRHPKKEWVYNNSLVPLPV